MATNTLNYIKNNYANNVEYKQLTVCNALVDVTSYYKFATEETNATLATLAESGVDPG